MADLEHKDPKAFWKSVKKMLAPSENCIPVNSIAHSKWLEHFTGVLNTDASGNINPQFLEYITSALPRLEDESSIDVELNSEITREELLKTIKNVKSGKAAYVDDISNDAIKTGLPILEKSLLHLYNTVTFSHTFPDSWNEGIVTPIHKKGNKLDVDNYRGIIISSCVGKIFLKIITTRIESYMYRLDLWKVNQCGFKRSSD